MVQEPGTWAGLKHDASQNLLYFDPAAAVTGADAAGRMIEQMMAMKAAISDYGMDSVIDFTGGVLGSSRELAEIYIQRAERLKVVLQDHINIGTEMANAFIQAGLYYKRVEEENSDALDKLNDYKVPTESSAEVALTHSRFGDLDLPEGEKRDAGNAGTEDDFRYTDAYDVPDELHDYVGRQESISPEAVGLENSASLGMREFRGLADKTGWGIFGLAGNSQGWWRLAANTRTELQKFEESIESIQNKWRGDAANKARTATKNYTDAIAPLWKSMFSMSENMHYSAEWLRRTQMSMPQQDFEFTSESIKQAVLQRYREEWEKHYAEGMKNSLREMPVIEGPIAEPKPPPDNDDTDNNNENNNNGGGENNGGGGENNGGGGRTTAAGRTTASRLQRKRTTRATTPDTRKASRRAPNRAATKATAGVKARARAAVKARARARAAVQAKAGVKATAAAKAAVKKYPRCPATTKPSTAPATIQAGIRSRTPQRISPPETPRAPRSRLRSPAPPCRRTPRQPISSANSPVSPNRICPMP
ncbi:hypothetical protein [Nocardia carnea]|uniref:hypothetical protein n=1 Tax=Nocardia carnea TaxID=37328 RepID=UPI0002D8C187|nr:hypothetical protein [Nocardia carnea]